MQKGITINYNGVRTAKPICKFKCNGLTIIAVEEPCLAEQFKNYKVMLVTLWEGEYVNVPFYEISEDDDMLFTEFLRNGKQRRQYKKVVRYMMEHDSLPRSSCIRDENKDMHSFYPQGRCDGSCEEFDTSRVFLEGFDDFLFGVFDPSIFPRMERNGVAPCRKCLTRAAARFFEYKYESLCGARRLDNSDFSCLGHRFLVAIKNEHFIDDTDFDEEVCDGIMEHLLLTEFFASKSDDEATNALVNIIEDIKKKDSEDYGLDFGDWKD